ncbi:LysE family translocator [Bradyrhizobium sp. USDA 4011]
MLFVGTVSTSIAYWLWGRLLRDYPAAQVVPFALLVPFVGSAASSIVFVGITVGFAFMVGAVGVGLGAVFIAYPVLQTILKYGGVAYLLYLAAVIAMAEPPSADKDDRPGRGPMTFWGAAMFQWINAKGWVMVIGTITAYAAIAAFPWNIAIQVGLSLVLGTVSCIVWALFGTALRPILTSPRAIRIFNVVMAILLLASLYPVFMDA